MEISKITKSWIVSDEFWKKVREYIWSEAETQQRYKSMRQARPTQIASPADSKGDILYSVDKDKRSITYRLEKGSKIIENTPKAQKPHSR